MSNYLTVINIHFQPQTAEEKAYEPVLDEQRKKREEIIKKKEQRRLEMAAQKRAELKKKLEAEGIAN